MYRKLVEEASRDKQMAVLQKGSFVLSEQQQQQQQQHFISPHNIQEIKIYNNSTDDDRGAGCPK